MDAFDLLDKAGAEFAILHCTSEYPVSPRNVNLRAIERLREVFRDTVIGFSSHVDRMWGPSLEVAAYALGARIIEKHFTITPEINTGEHAFALDGLGLNRLVVALGTASEALGDGQKRLLCAEAAGVLRLGKHLAYSRDLLAGAVLSETHLAVLGGGAGVAPNRLAGFVGGVLTRDVRAGEAAREDDVQVALCPAS